MNEVRGGSRSFARVAGLLFGAVALMHLLRLVERTPVTAGTTAIPLWVSWLGLFVAGALSVWGFRAARR